jgi:CRP-like cAMP-binding protein
MKQGDEAGFAFFIRKGSVSVEYSTTIDTSSTCEQIVRRNERDLIGELSLFSKIRSSSVIAITPVECARISHSVLLQLVTSTPALALSLLAIVMKKAQEK